MDYQIIEAFAPKLYMGKADANLLTFCKEKENELRSTRENNQTFIPLNISETDRITFLSQLNAHVSSAINEFNKNLNRFNLDDNERLIYDLGKGPWIQYIKSNYFQPMLRSPGMITGMIFLDVPAAFTDFKNAEGDLSFVYGEDGLWHSSTVNLKPETGDIIIFPSYLRHQFYPFSYSLEYPILGFNIFNIRKPEGES